MGTDKINRFILIAILVIFVLLIGVLMKIFGEYNYPTIILTLLATGVIIGVIVFIYNKLTSKEGQKETKEFEISKEDAMKLAREKFLQEDGIIVGEEEVSNVVSIGDNSGTKDPYLFWIFYDSLDTNIKVAYFRNLKKINVEGKIFGTKSDKKFMETAVLHLNSTASPRRDEATYVKRRYDPETGEVLFEEQGTHSPMVYQQELKKDEIEIVKDDKPKQIPGEIKP